MARGRARTPFRAYATTSAAPSEINRVSALPAQAATKVGPYILPGYATLHAWRTASTIRFCRASTVVMIDFTLAFAFAGSR
jgi:hypothetical protein